MTQAPSHPPVHGYSGENPFDLVDSAWGNIERWRAQALATGEASGLTAIADHVRNDAVAAMDALEEREATVAAREDACSARERVHAVNVANFVDFVRKASALFDRLDRLRADAQEEPLASPPGIEPDPSKEPEPSLELLEDEEQPAHGDPPGDPEPPVTTDQTEFPEGELPHPPVEQQPIAAGLDDAEEFEEEKHGD